MALLISAPASGAALARVGVIKLAAEGTPAAAPPPPDLGQVLAPLPPRPAAGLLDFGAARQLVQAKLP